MLSAACLIGTVLLTSRLAALPALAVYALSFWHYLFYWWAYRHGAVQPARFRGDAMLMKSVALTALAGAYLTQSWHWISALAIGAGFMLNLAAARALGHTRTYYGWELGELPRRRVTSFPYSVVPHPMLVGNMMAFGGTLLHPGFRRAWWPLAALHVALNGALIAMETSVTPTRRTPRAGAVPAWTRRGGPHNAGPQSAAWAATTAIGAVFAAGVAAVLAWPAGWAPVAVVAGASAAYGYAQRGWYVPAASPEAPRNQHQTRSQGGPMSRLRAPMRQDVVGSQSDDRESSDRRLAGGRFRATVGTFAGGPLQPTIDGLTRWVEHAYRRQLEERPSMHVYVRKLAPDVIARIDQLRGSSVILEAIRRQFPPSSVITPLPHTDELYISHYNKDRGGDQGLFDKHYDGNLRFVRFVSVVRALIYLQSDTSYTVVFGDSGVRRAFSTYEFGLLDFHRELHWVEGSYTPGGPQRILLKCNYLVAPANAGWAARLVMAANTAVFYVVKAAMEYSKSPRTLPQKAVGLVCNAARSLNNVHPLVPILLTVVLSLAAGWGVFALLSRG